MATYNLSSTDLNEHATDAVEVVSKVYRDYPITYRVKEIVVTDITTPNYTSPPTVTIDSPFTTVNFANSTSYTAGQYVITTSNNIYLVETSCTSGTTAPSSTDPTTAVLNGTATMRFVGIRATAVASIVKPADGGESTTVVRVIVTHPGYGYTSVPTVTIAADTLAVAVIEIDPLSVDLRNHLVASTNTQIKEEAIHINTAKIEDLRVTTDTKLEDLRLTTETKLEDLREDLETVLQEIRDEFDVNLTENLASIIQNIDNAVSGLILSGRFNLTSVSGSYVLGEIVTAATGSGRVLQFDSISNIVVIGYIEGVFTNGQVLTGQTSSATGTFINVIPFPPTPTTSNDQIARGMMVLTLKATDTLDSLRQEIQNPTPI